MTIAALAEATDLPHEIDVEGVRESHGDRSVEDARILIVDDDPTAALLMTRLLERDGFWRVVSTGGGWRALAMMLQHPPDVMILDVHMPDLDGIQVLREMQHGERGARSVTGVLAVSGDAAAATCDAMLQAGADDFVLRPFAGAEFALRVRRLAHASRELRKTVNYVDFLERGLTAE
jgi:DNA-binding response OmpR family regulator